MPAIIGQVDRVVDHDTTTPALEWPLSGPLGRLVWLLFLSLTSTITSRLSARQTGNAALTRPTCSDDFSTTNFSLAWEAKG